MLNPHLLNHEKIYGVGKNLFAIGTCCSSGIINLLEMGFVVDLNWQV
jgi:hypothetical protein